MADPALCRPLLALAHRAYAPATRSPYLDLLAGRDRLQPAAGVEVREAALVFRALQALGAFRVGDALREALVDHAIKYSDEARCTVVGQTGLLSHAGNRTAGQIRIAQAIEGAIFGRFIDCLLSGIQNRQVGSVGARSCKIAYALPRFA